MYIIVSKKFISIGIDELLAIPFKNSKLAIFLIVITEG